jgi:hypothetical protein
LAAEAEEPCDVGSIDAIESNLARWPPHLHAGV